mmetsp:Transcript_10485/g.28764  ORF Transcript_10485/g.28764 Transcript_10485/m.28764 type:complete len:252 (-) Transcript_10485:912-1667(-)
MNMVDAAERAVLRVLHRVQRHGRALRVRAVDDGEPVPAVGLPRETGDLLVLVWQLEHIDRNVLLTHAKNLQVRGRRLFRLCPLFDAHGQVVAIRVPGHTDIRDGEQILRAHFVPARRLDQRYAGRQLALLLLVGAQDWVRGAPLERLDAVGLDGALIEQSHFRGLVDGDRVLPHDGQERGTVLRGCRPLEGRVCHAAVRTAGRANRVVLLRALKHPKLATRGHLVHGQRVPRRLPPLRWDVCIDVDVLFAG